MNIRHLSSVIHHHSAWNTSEFTLWFCSQKLATSDTPAKYSSQEWPGFLASFLTTHSFMKYCIISLLNSATLGPNLPNSEVDDYNIKAANAGGKVAPDVNGQIDLTSVECRIQHIFIFSKLETLTLHLLHRKQTLGVKFAWIFRIVNKFHILKLSPVLGCSWHHLVCTRVWYYIGRGNELVTTKQKNFFLSAWNKCPKKSNTLASHIFHAT